MHVSKTSDPLITDHVREALRYWQRGDGLMALFYLDKAGFTGIETLFGAAP